eukprot:scaffold5075_cov109-Isochrysis_galbana.AAC.5
MVSNAQCQNAAIGRERPKRPTRSCVDQSQSPVGLDSVPIKISMHRAGECAVCTFKLQLQSSSIQYPVKELSSEQ